MRRFPLLFVIATLLVAACQQQEASTAAEQLPPFVKTVAVRTAVTGEIRLSGTVRARNETPLAFQVGGRVVQRGVDAGERVTAGQVLFELDPHDLQQGVRAAEADLAAADTAVATAAAELARARQLQARNFTSAQALERFELGQREAQTRREAAAARLVQARNALSYARLKAPADGVLVDVVGEPGQVVAVGQQLALLARAGERELEVNFAGGTPPPSTGWAVLDDGTELSLSLRETAGAVEPQGRTLRARYTVLGARHELVLGEVLRARFVGHEGVSGEFVVPLAAINERGTGAQVWRVRDGVVTPVAVTLLGSDGENANIRGELSVGEHIVALGTHLLIDGMAVRELGR